MAGITRISTYVPRRRLDRTVIGQTWGTRVAPGRRAVAGLDEDALTMAVDAALACLDGADPAHFDALYFASTSAPYLEKQVASVVATATDLPRATAVADFGGSVRAGVTALRAAIDAVWAGSVRSALVVAADARSARPTSGARPTLRNVRGATRAGSWCRRSPPKSVRWGAPSRWRCSVARSRPRRPVTSSSSPDTAKVPTRSCSARPTRSR